MAAKRSLYLTDTTLSLMRRIDSCSGRVNEVSDRYAEMLRQETGRIRALFTTHEWQRMADALADWTREQSAAAIVGAIEAKLAQSAITAEHSALQLRVSAMRPADRIILAELLERHRFG